VSARCEVKHGTAGGYAHGCRCEGCRRAHNEYMREYNQRPEVKAKRREYNQRPEVKAKLREYRTRPEVQARKMAADDVSGRPTGFRSDRELESLLAKDHMGADGPERWL
jgi:hypothetical protein